MTNAFSGIDPLSQDFHDTYDPGIDHLCDALDGDVHSQGIPLDHRDWLDMGSEGWQQASDEVKAAAFQAANIVGGWETAQLKELMLRRYRHLKPSIMDLTIDTLQQLAAAHPLQVEDVAVKVAEVEIKRPSPSPIIISK